MVLYIHSDASYLSESRARSRAAGHFFLSSKPLYPTKPPVNIPVLNGPIHTLCQIIDVVVGSAAESEIGSGYLNGQAAVPIVITLGELGHNQPATPMQVDNTTAEGFANDTIKQKRSKAMDMRWRWLQDRVRQGQFLVFPPGHHQHGRPIHQAQNACANKNFEAKFCAHKSHRSFGSAGCSQPCARVCQIGPRPYVDRTSATAEPVPQVSTPGHH